MREHETIKYSTETFSELKSRITLYLWIFTATDTFAIGRNPILSWPCQFNDVFFHPSLKMLFVNRYSCSWFVRLVEQVVEPIFRIEPANQPNPSSHYPHPEKKVFWKTRKCTTKKSVLQKWEVNCFQNELAAGIHKVNLIDFFHYSDISVV